MSSHKEHDSCQRWKIRRRVVNSVLVYSGASISYIMFFGEDTVLNQNLSGSLVLLCASVIGSYIFGATWDDKR